MNQNDRSRRRRARAWAKNFPIQHPIKFQVAQEFDFSVDTRTGLCAWLVLLKVGKRLSF